MSLASHSSITALLLGLSLVGANVSASAEPGEATDGDVAAYNYVLGTQTIGTRYQFTDQTALVETAQEILRMGSNILKISMSRRYSNADYGLGRQEFIRSLTDLAKDEPSFRKVLSLPFAHYHIWAYCFQGARWQDGLSDEEGHREYRELNDFARHLLTSYRNTGKTFYLGHWEGDWHLHPNYDAARDPSPEALKGMIDWLNVRQRAIDDAKRSTPHAGVGLYHYTEVNLVKKAVQGGRTLTNDVLPHTNVDYVSYSMYDMLADPVSRGLPDEETFRRRVVEALDHIESRLPPKPHFLGKRVWIGEYGFPLRRVKSPALQEQRSRQVMRIGLEWGCPFVLYWEMYCNENKDGTHRGFWLIDNRNQKQPVYFTHQRFFKDAKSYVAEFQQRHDRLPTPAEFRTAAVRFLDPE